MIHTDKSRAREHLLHHYQSHSYLNRNILHHLKIENLDPLRFMCVDYQLYFLNLLLIFYYKDNVLCYDLWVQKKDKSCWTPILTLSSPCIVTNAVLAFLTKGSPKKCQNSICYVLLVKNTSKSKMKKSPFLVWLKCTKSLWNSLVDFF